NEEVRDFIELYENSYFEKEKLWKLLGLSGLITQDAEADLLSRIIKFVLDSKSIFCINSVRDYLGLADIFKGDPYQNRVNVPGTISTKNWSLKLPIGLEELLKHPINKKIRKMIVDSARI
ncbi:MAG: 4-alpha-glucanotransferase, partial [Candidatus Omnitrophota bacterium]|nr:4-alpha-glucanotransferase [Candidatus Omnitrophota bacterium]